MIGMEFHSFYSEYRRYYFESHLTFLTLAPKTMSRTTENCCGKLMQGFKNKRVYALWHTRYYRSIQCKETAFHLIFHVVLFFPPQNKNIFHSTCFRIVSSYKVLNLYIIYLLWVEFKLQVDSRFFSLYFMSGLLKNTVPIYNQIHES